MFYTIKNGNSAEDTLSALRTDNFATADLHNFPILMSLTVNFQSLLAKKESFINLLDTYNPDIVFGKESWLKPDVLSSEAFPEGHSVYGQTVVMATEVFYFLSRNSYFMPSGN